MTHREKLEARLERRHEWAESRRKKAAAKFDAVHRLADSIPIGQPILVGHHSEGRARRDQDRIHNGMSAAIESQTMAATHESKASGIAHQLDNSIFSDDENAVEELKARIAEREAEVARIKLLNAAIRKEFKAGLPEGWLTRIGATEKEKLAISRNVEFGWQHTPMFPAYHLTNLNGRIRADRERIKTVEARAVQTAEAEAAPDGILIERFGESVKVVFAEKPARSVLDALKAAGFFWTGGGWHGKADKLPSVISRPVTIALTGAEATTTAGTIEPEPEKETP